MAALNFVYGSLHARVGGHIDLDELDGKALGAEVLDSLFSAFAVARAHKHQDTLSRELAGDFPADAFVRAGYECDGLSHRHV